MEKITEFRNTLAVPIHKLSIDSLVQEVCLCPEYFEDIYRLTYDEKTDGVMASNMGMREIERNPSRLVHPTVR